MFFRGKVQEEEGYILYVRKNALQILIPKYGLECTLYVIRKNSKVIFEFDEETQTQKCGDIVFHAFDPVIIRLVLNSSNIQHEKIVLELVSPYIEGFSVPRLVDEENKKMEVDEIGTKSDMKRKSDDDSEATPDKNKRNRKKHRKMKK